MNRKVLAALAALLVAPYIMAPTGGFPAFIRFSAVGVGTAPGATSGNLTATGTIQGGGLRGTSIGVNQAPSGTAGQIKQTVASGGIFWNGSDGTVNAQCDFSGSVSYECGTLGNIQYALYTNSAARFIIGGAGNVTVQAPASGSAVTIAGVSGTNALIVNSGSGASGVGGDVQINRTASTCNAVGQGTGLGLTDTTGTQTSLLMDDCSTSSGVGNAEWWQFSSNAWVRVALLGSTHQWQMYEPAQSALENVATETVTTGLTIPFTTASGCTTNGTNAVISLHRIGGTVTGVVTTAGTCNITGPLATVSGLIPAAYRPTPVAVNAVAHMVWTGTCSASSGSPFPGFAQVQSTGQFGLGSYNCSAPTNISWPIGSTFTYALN